MLGAVVEQLDQIILVPSGRHRNLDVV